MPPEGSQDWREILIAAAALRSGLLAAMTEPRRPGDLAAAARLEPRAVAIVTAALVDLGYASADADGRIGLTATGEGALSPGPDGRDAGADLLLGERSIRNHLRLDRALAGEPPGDDVSRGDTEERMRFLRAMRNIAAPRAPLTAAAVGPPPPGGRLLDIGGAPGTYAQAFAAAGWSVTVMDLPEMLAVTGEDLAQAGIATIPGNATEGVPPGPWQAVYIGNLLHLLDAPTAERLVAGAAAALEPGGVLAIQELMRGRAPQAHLFAVLMLLATPGGDTYAEDDYRAWAERGGCRVERVVDLDDRQHQLMISRRDGGRAPVR
jgi:2-polyprenyl-3-methyl-5-hydroxy-6-metoxy-1,4-benzoquinol methylase